MPRSSAPPRRRPSASRGAAARHVYSFGPEGADGHRELGNLLGGKGANLAEMCNLGLPVPPGFTITTEVCTAYSAEGGRYPDGLEAEVDRALAELERAMEKRFGDPHDPLLVSVRSGARVSMPGMMDTVLNLGLSRATAAGLAERSKNPRFAWDAYRRFVQMYGDVVLGIGADAGEHQDPFSAALDALKAKRKARLDTELGADDLEALARTYEEIVERRSGAPFPQDPREQLWGAIGAVFRSWDTDRAVAYRQMNGIPGDWGTAVNVQAMVFGNLGETSGTGVAFTRDPASGEKRFYGEYLMNAQGEDVVAGIRTPHPIEDLEKQDTKVWKELLRIQKLLEDHYREMQDLEFTIEDGRLYMLQCRTGKRTGFAAVRIAVDMVKEGRIEPEEAVARVDPESLNQLLQPVFEPKELKVARAEGRVLCRGLNAGPGAATGRVVFDAETATEWGRRGETVILARVETSPEDIRGMQASTGILTARGGMTSHAALVARQMGKVCVAGADDVEIDYKKRTLAVGKTRLKEGGWISLDGTTGDVIAGQVPTRPSDVSAALLGGRGGAAGRKSAIFKAYEELLGWADATRTMGVRTNADQPDQCKNAIAFGAEGVGLCRTEHMFFGEKKIGAVRRMILAETAQERETALAALLPLQRRDFEGIFKAMGERPVTIRTLDPPLHEFLPHDAATQREIAAELGITPKKLAQKLAHLAELNPMLGHRGCRLGVTHPEITRMQARAIFEAACNVAKKTGVVPRPEVMIPLVGAAKELELQTAVVRQTAREVFDEKGLEVPYLVGTMIELPRAALTAGAIARTAEFFSFGTNDLTQTTYGISRDDAGKFIPEYIDLEIFPADPFATLDRDGVGRLMGIACEEGRRTRPDLKLGICGEHGGDPRSIEVCQELDLAYVSCSPFRVPVARLAAAQSALRARG